MHKDPIGQTRRQAFGWPVRIGLQPRPLASPEHKTCHLMPITLSRRRHQVRPLGFDDRAPLTRDVFKVHGDQGRL